MELSETTETGHSTAGDAVTTRRRRLVAAGAACIVLFFAGQQVVTETLGEPYPALVLPSFGANIDSDVVTRRTPDLRVDFADGDSRRIGARSFVAGASRRPFDLLNTMFWVHTERVASRRHVPDDPATTAFTRSRLQQLFPDRTPVRFAVVWTRWAVNLDGTFNEQETKVVRTVDVDL